MKVLLTVVAALAVVAAVEAGSGGLGKGEVFTWGHAAYTYGPLHCTQYDCDVVPSCNRAKWSTDIGDYNKNANPGSQINVVYSYGGDIEFWAGKSKPDGCHKPASTDPNSCNVSIYYDVNNRKAASVYKSVEKVDSIVSLIDSRMDGWEQIKTYNDFDGCKFGNFYPDLRNLTDAGLQKLADDTAKLYCACPECGIIDGVQVDLEPYVDPYKQSLDDFIGKVATNFRDEDGKFGCKDADHPQGRSVSYFTFAHAQSTKFTSLLGDNGYYVFSGYDLFPKPGDGGFMYNNVTEFADKLRREITYMRPVIGDKGKFTLALPIGASCHEYEQYRPMQGKGCGPACEALTSGITMDQYVQAWFDVLLDPATTKATNGLFCLSKEDDSQFLGMSLWSYSYQMTYPPMKWFDNEFLPGSPPASVMKILNDNLYKLSDGKTTCL
jgi:hypothetical protein